MAQVIFQQLYKRETFTCQSAGTNVRSKHPEISMKNSNSAQVCALHGLSLQSHTPRQITVQDLFEYDYIFCMDKANLESVLEMKRKSPPSNCNISLLGKQKEVKDPYGESLEIYQETFAAIKQMIQEMDFF